MIRVPGHFIEMELPGNAFLVKPTNKQPFLSYFSTVNFESERFVK